MGVAVNTSTNRIYVTSQKRPSLTVVDGVTETVLDTLPLGRGPFHLAVNPVTNRIYIADPLAHRVWAADGDSLSIIAEISTGKFPIDLALNPVTNRIYVVNTDDQPRLTVIDGDTNGFIARIAMPSSPHGVAVNPETNKIYVASSLPAMSKIVIVDGVNHAILKTIGFLPGHLLDYLDIDGPAHRLYVDDFYDPMGTYQLVVIDTDTDTGIRTISPLTEHLEVAVDPSTHRVHLTHWCYSNTSVVYADELLANPSFHRTEGDGVEPWRGRGLTDSDGLEEAPCPTGSDLVYEGRYSFRLTGTPGVEKELSQTVRLVGAPGTILHLEGSSRAADSSVSGGRYQIRAKALFTDGSTEESALHFRKSTHPWRRETEAFVAPKAFDRVRVSLVYANQTGDGLVRRHPSLDDALVQIPDVGSTPVAARRPGASCAARWTGAIPQTPAGPRG